MRLGIFHPKSNWDVAPLGMAQTKTHRQIETVKTDDNKPETDPCRTQLWWEKQLFVHVLYTTEQST